MPTPEMERLETGRLLLRRLLTEDAESLHREIYSDHEVVKHYNENRVFTLDEVREFLPRRRNSGQFGYWTVTLKVTGEVIGQVHLDTYANLDWFPLADECSLLCQTPEVHLGFAFGKRFWGQGYASEACRELIRYAFRNLRLLRLLGGADIDNPRSIRLHERLGYRLIYDARGVVAILSNPLASYRIRPFEETDREAANTLEDPVVDWWHSEVDGASLHLVVETIETGGIVGHLQVRDRSVPEPSRRPGQCHFMLSIAASHRKRGIGGYLYDRTEAFASSRKASLLYAAYQETLDSPAASFLQKRGFLPIERFFASSLDLSTFDPTEFTEAIEHVRRQGIVLTTYAVVGDTAEHRLRLYALEQAARTAQPFREVEPYVAEPYAKWEKEFIQRDRSTVFLALAPDTGDYVGIVTGLEWYFTGTHSDWIGRGIATALKVLCLKEAKVRGIGYMETENHEDNHAMLAINRKLGFVFTDPEVACIKRLS